MSCLQLYAITLENVIKLQLITITILITQLCTVPWCRHSSDLNFNHHSNHVTSNASKSLDFLKRNIKTKHSDICSSVWSLYTKKDIHKVEMGQRRATHWIL